MSQETSQTLNTLTLIGFTDKRGHKAWHYRADLQGDEPNHYGGAIPVEDVRRRLFDWSAEEAPVFVGVRGDDDSIIRYVEEKNRKAIVRSDNHDVLGVFKNSYTIHQYDQWLIENVSSLIDDHNLSIGSAGCLRNGGIAWVTIEMPENVTTSSGYDVRPYLLATTSHNGTIATTYKRVYNVPVCDNTLFAGLSEDGLQHKTRHSKNSIGKLQGVRDALDIVFSMTEDIVAEVESLSNITVTDRQWEAIVNRLIPVGVEGEVANSSISKMQNKREAIRDLYRNSPMVSPWSGTALGVLQAFNTFAHHVSGGDKNRVERNALNAITGKIQTADQQVLSTIKELVLA